MTTKIGLLRTYLALFVLVDDAGDEVAGLGTTFVVQISKNGGAFATGAGTKAEIGSGWYSYLFPTSETDSAGPLAAKVTGSGVVQQNLLFFVSGSAYDAPSGTFILTAEEAAIVLRCEEDDPNMLVLLPAIDAYIEMATGRRWQDDDPVHELAKNAARILLVRAHEDPGAMAQPPVSLSWGLAATLTQLEALAYRYFTFEGLSGAGGIALAGASKGDTVGSVVGRVGVSGDQGASFETVITVDGQIQQISSSDLSGMWFTAYLVPAEAV